MLGRVVQETDLKSYSDLIDKDVIDGCADYLGDLKLNTINKVVLLNRKTQQESVHSFVLDSYKFNFNKNNNNEKIYQPEYGIYLGKVLLDETVRSKKHLNISEPFISKNDHQRLLKAMNRPRNIFRRDSYKDLLYSLSNIIYLNEGKDFKNQGSDFYVFEDGFNRYLNVLDKLEVIYKDEESN